nr:MAG TPA: hypothetical protein [Caudoviricetes sp.]
MKRKGIVPHRGDKRWQSGALRCSATQWQGAASTR